ncbi:MAG: SBBP repeat-containing protein [Pseudomonadota bacterium]
MSNNANSDNDLGLDSSTDSSIDSKSDQYHDSSADLLTDQPCIPDCTGRMCGPDPACGTLCGNCTGTEICDTQGLCVPSPSWALAPSGTLPTKGNDIAQDNNGNTYVTGLIDGYVQGTSTFGSTSFSPIGSANVFVTKVLPSGQFDWTLSFGPPIMLQLPPTTHEGKGIAVDTSGNVYITGYFEEQVVFGNINLVTKGQQDVFVAKILPTGQIDWAISVGGEKSDKAYSITLDTVGNAYVTGEFSGQATFGNTTLSSEGSADVFVAKVLSSGQTDWAISAGGGNSDKAYSIALDNTGNAYISGEFWEQPTFGTTTLSSEGNGDIFVAKVLPTGQFDWTISAGGTYWDKGNSIAVETSGNVYVTGEFGDEATFGAITLSSKGNWDMFVAKVLPSGQFDWALSAGETSEDKGKDIALDNSGNIYVTGHFHDKEQVTFGTTTLTSQGNWDVFVAKVLPTGQFDWAIPAGGTTADDGIGIALDADSNMYVTGNFGEPAAFGSTTLSGVGWTNTVFVWKEPQP